MTGTLRRLLRGTTLAALVVAACTPTEHRREPIAAEPPVPASAAAAEATSAAEAASATPAASAEPASAAGPVVREEQVVVVDGREERWSLVWASPPKLNCVDDGWQTCMCFGRELGERGPLTLVRVRADGTEQRLALGTVALPRWRLEPADKDRFPGKVDVSAVRGRPLVKVMTVGDYDHDGRATELVIERRDDFCGDNDAVVVGVTRDRDELHVFATDDTPPVAISLSHATDWEAIRKRLPAELVYIPCGFKGGWPTFEMIQVSRDTRGLHARHRRYACDWVRGSPVRGKRLLDRPWTGDVEE
jgi:hypothetical protein